MDWRKQGILSSVKDQGDCAAGWAFAVADLASADYAYDSGEVLEFSAQELLDCTDKKRFGNDGCNGGSVINVLEKWYMKRHYMSQEKDYPYVSGETGSNQRCDYDGYKTTGIYVKSYAKLIPDSVTLMKSWLAEGPMTVAINADHMGFKNYKRGVFTARDCDSEANHFVLAVGYGKDKATNTEYWIVKNSWGESWGEDGYARVEIREGEGVCGIQREAIAVRTKCENPDFCGDLTPAV